MRCKNCGWENPDGLSKCEKCHSNLDIVVPDHNPTAPSSDRMRSTVSEGVIFGGSTPPPAPKTCPRCGYPLSEGTTKCPNCDYEVMVAPTSVQSVKCKACGKEIDPTAKFCPHCGTSTSTASSPSPSRKIQRAPMGTVLGGPITGPQSPNAFCTLRPIAWAGEEVNYNPITYSGDVIILNRSNTDANNNSITSREQAVLTCEDGDWYIENRSDLKTTFIRVNGKIKLNSGDIIVLGNREFEFKAK